MTKSVSETHDTPFVGIFDSLREKFESGNTVYQDGLHPNNEGHQLIFELVRPALDEMLNT